MKNIILKVDNLKFKYEDSEKDIVNDVSFTVEKGKWISILGHNGSGKSTLAKLLLGLLEKESGNITYYLNNENIELNQNNLNKIRQIAGIVFQNPDNQFVGVTVKHDIAFGLENRQVEYLKMKEKIAEVAKLVDMYEYLDREPETLSGGQKQRVAIAGLIACDLDLFIFDEATSMLDPKGKNEVIELIKKLNKEYNKTIITITHDIELACKSDVSLILKNGKLIYNDISKNLFKDVKLLNSSNLVIPEVVSLINKLDKQKYKKEIEALWELIF